MYSDWRIRRWDSPISDLKSVALVSLLDDGVLHITVEAPRDPDRRRWKFSFKTPPGYRNLLEECRTELWEHLDRTRQTCGNTFIVVDSPWVSYLNEHEDLFSVHYPNVEHYVIQTEDDVVEVLAQEPPTIEDLGPTPPDAPPAGKSDVLYHPEDRDKIESVLHRLKRRSRQR